MTDKNNTKTVRVKDKIKAIYPHIVVGGKIDKPCFSIHWYDVKKKEMYIGYSSYNLNYVREWLKENFEIVEPEIDNLLKRQKTEIERLEKARQRQAYLSCNIRGQKYELMNRISAVKNEAYKEFAERLKSYLLLNKKGEMSVISFENVDNLLKEMVGEDR